jgi:hypothetical protein
VKARHELELVLEDAPLVLGLGGLLPLGAFGLLPLVTALEVRLGAVLPF